MGDSDVPNLHCHSEDLVWARVLQDAEIFHVMPNVGNIEKVEKYIWHDAIWLYFAFIFIFFYITKNKQEGDWFGEQ